MLKVHNTLTGKKEKFDPLQPGKVKMYVCGLTVQNYSHLGHIRSAINYDVIRRYLEYRGYDVTYVQNFTDINEKIIARARKEGLTPEALAGKYTEAYLADIDALNIKRADIYCNATDHIQEMQDITEKLLEKGYAYEKEGSVYFDVRKFSEYGKLSGRKIEDMEVGSRVEVSEDKNHPLDFALWKKVEDEEPAWESPWGKGWPGWHIECSAMSMKYLGNKFDIHGGGTDLIFPHHENEIAQSEACSGEKPFVKYWLHNGTVNLKGEKMSKSVGNFFTTRELLQKYDPDVIRYFVLGKHYHSPIDFSLEELDKAEKSLSGLQNTLKTIRRLIEKEPVAGENQGFSEHKLVDLLKEKRQEFEAAMDNDFNTARGLAVIHELATEMNTLINDSDFKLSGNNIILLREADNLFRRLTGVLGIKLDEDRKQTTGGKLTEDLIDYILKLREEAREQKNFEFADRIRDDLSEMGIVVRDGPRGVIWDFKKEEQNGD